MQHGIVSASQSDRPSALIQYLPAKPVMNTTPVSASSKSFSQRWFYSLASLTLLVLMFIGFQYFYLQGKAYPGRPLTPPMRTLVIVHGVLMTGWMLLAVVQPLLVAKKRVRLHMKLGLLGVALALGIVIAGIMVGIEGARYAPPDLLLFDLNPKQFMTVPVLGILVFGLFVLIGVLNRYRSHIHRPMMLIASVSVMSAAMGRMRPLSMLIADTWCEAIFSAFFSSVVLAVIFLAVKCLLFRAFDRWFTAGVVLFAALSAALTQIAKTAAWDQFATFLQS